MADYKIIEAATRTDRVWTPERLCEWEWVPHCQFRNIQQRLAGVYAVVATWDHLLYVGQSQDLRSRLLTHLKSINSRGQFQVGRAHILLVRDKRERLNLERAILSDVRPYFNGSFPSLMVH